MPFVDGEPIDASKLGALETQLNELKATMPKIGASSTSISVTQNTTNSSVNNSTVQAISVPQIYGSITADVSLTPGKRSYFDIDYAAAGLTAIPKAIILTPRGTEKTFSINQALVLSGSVTATKARGHVYHRSDADACTVKYYFMVIVH